MQPGEQPRDHQLLWIRATSDQHAPATAARNCHVRADACSHPHDRADRYTAGSSLTPRYGALLLMAPRLGQPAQTLNGTISGGIPGHNVTLYVAPPGGAQVTYDLAPGGSFSFGPAEAGDLYFGVSQEGTWRAWFTVTDSGGRNATSNTVTWVVGLGALVVAVVGILLVAPRYPLLSKSPQPRRMQSFSRGHSSWTCAAMMNGISSISLAAPRFRWTSCKTG